MYAEQWEVLSMTDRIDPDTGEIFRYKLSRTREGTYMCSCGAWKFQRSKLFNGRKAMSWEIPNGRCKHIQAHIEGRETHEREIEEGQPVSFKTEEYEFKLVDNGRINGFIASLQSPIE
jgi:cold shock CspA family protein